MSFLEARKRGIFSPKINVSSTTTTKIIVRAQKLEKTAPDMCAQITDEKIALFDRHETFTS